MRSLVFALALVNLPATAQSPAAAPPQWAAEVTALTNAERAKAGSPSLTLDDRLSKAAQAHTDEMARRQTLAHEGANGSNPGQRASATGYTWNAIGENIAAGQPPPSPAGWRAASSVSSALRRTKKAVDVSQSSQVLLWFFPSESCHIK